MGFTADGIGELGRSAGHGTPGEEGDGAAAPSEPRASVVVATIGRPDRLPGLVDRALADPGTLELLVVVDGPDPASVAVLEDLAHGRPSLRLVAIDHVGHLAALEEGVRRASGDVVVLLDDDVLPEIGTIAGHARHHRDTTGLVVAGPMPVGPVEGSWSVATRLYADEYDGHVRRLLDGDVQLLDVLWAGNLSLRRDDCLRAGLRSDEFASFYHSDRDLGYRWATAGLVGRFDPSLRATHLHERNDTAFLRDARRQGWGRAELHRVHPDLLGPFVPQSLVADLPRLLRLAVRAAGATPAADRVAAALMAFGRCARSLGTPGAQLALARLARRIMQWRGAVAGAAGSPSTAARAWGPAPVRT